MGTSDAVCPSEVARPGASSSLRPRRLRTPGVTAVRGLRPFSLRGWLVRAPPAGSPEGAGGRGRPSAGSGRAPRGAAGAQLRRGGRGCRSPGPAAQPRPRGGGGGAGARPQRRRAGGGGAGAGAGAAAAAGRWMRRAHPSPLGVFPWRHGERRQRPRGSPGARGGRTMTGRLRGPGRRRGWR